jgi:glycosyltransferase involved in cell wall biosynthesis
MSSPHETAPQRALHAFAGGQGTVHIVVPEGIDDPARPSGGNFYDRRVCDGLTEAGWDVREHGVTPESLGTTIGRLPDGALVVVDGLIASRAAAVLVPAALRVRLVVLMHMPVGDPQEAAVVSAADAVLTTSAWTRSNLLHRYPLDAARVVAAPPGAELADVVPGTAVGGELLCVAAVAAHKGHGDLVDALVSLTDLPWRLTMVGTLDRDPEFVRRLRKRATAAGIADRMIFRGPLIGAELNAAYAGADVLVLPSRGETYGMVVTEALARGLPVIASSVGGVPEALGRVGPIRPGLLVPAGNRAALSAALCRWLGDEDLRQRLRHAARARRRTLTGWSATAHRVGRVLTKVAA